MAETPKTESRATTARPQSVAPASNVESRDEDTDKLAETQHSGYEPTEADYERARTTGVGREPELPPGIVRREDKNV